MTNEQIAKALRESDWHGVSIGNKAILEAAINALLFAREPAAALDDERAFEAALAKFDPRPYAPRAYSEQVWFRRGWDARQPKP